MPPTPWFSSPPGQQQSDRIRGRAVGEVGEVWLLWFCWETGLKTAQKLPAPGAPGLHAPCLPARQTFRSLHCWPCCSDAPGRRGEQLVSVLLLFSTGPSVRPGEPQEPLVGPMFALSGACGSSGPLTTNISTSAALT